LTPKVQAFARHYGTVILPTKPYTPRHNGRIEAGGKYGEEAQFDFGTGAPIVGSSGKPNADFEL
jgi:hypothetical protein